MIREIHLYLTILLVFILAANAFPANAPPTEKRWFLGIKASNYRPALAYFEQRIDSEINQPLSAIFPAWRHPETFKNWSDDTRIWDLWVEGGRSLTPRTSWFISAGGTGATIRNKQTYFPLGIPIATDIRFRGTELSLLGGLTFYPFGKPLLDSQSRSWSVVKQAVLRARPFGEIGVGYTFIRAEANVKLGFPMLDRLYKNKEKLDYHLLQINPRIGIEFPLNNDDSVSLAGSYRFFHNHGAEFDSPTISAIFKHKF